MESKIDKGHRYISLNLKNWLINKLIDGLIDSLIDWLIDKWGLYVPFCYNDDATINLFFVLYIIERSTKW